MPLSDISRGHLLDMSVIYSGMVIPEYGPACDLRVRVARLRSPLAPDRWVFAFAVWDVCVRRAPGQSEGIYISAHAIFAWVFNRCHSQIDIYSFLTQMSFTNELFSLSLFFTSSVLSVLSVLSVTCQVLRKMSGGHICKLRTPFVISGGPMHKAGASPVASLFVEWGDMA